jgi:hypothetical protein
MSDPQTPSPAGGPPLKRRRHVAISIIMFLCGLVLLLPGICALIFVSAGPLGSDSSLILLWAFCFAVSAGGIALIVQTFR